MLFSKLATYCAEVAICLQRQSMGGTVCFGLGHITAPARFQGSETLPEEQCRADEMPLV